MTRLAAEGLSGGYRKRPVLSAVSLAVRSGEVLALIGPNGAGKTTLLRSLARQLRPTAGTVELDAVSLWSRGPEWAARRVALAGVGKVPDRPLTVTEVVALGRAPHSGWLLPQTATDRDAVARALARVGCEAFSERRITELSAGEAQRVMLARALAQEPSVLIVDEPTSHLDLRYQGEVLDRLRQLAREGMAVVLALHDLNLVGLWADRAALVAGGTLLATGTPGEVLTAENLTAAYGVPVVVTQHPVFGTPLITPVPSDRRGG